MIPEDAKVGCAVCGHVLNGFQEYIGDRKMFTLGDRAYLHPFTVSDDHVPVPVLQADLSVTHICDFCGVLIDTDTWWALPVKDFEVPYSRGDQLPDHFIGDWAMCNDCASIIKRKAWGTLLSRQLAAMRAKMGHSPGGKEHLRRMLDLVQANMTGDAYRVSSKSAPKGID